MATDPVEGIRIEDFDTGYSTNLNAALRELANLEPSVDVPYLTVYLDWRPEGQRPATRGAETLFHHQSADLRDKYDRQSAAWDSLNQDIERIKAFLEEDLEPSVHGVVIVANSSRDVFEAFVLAIPVQTDFSVDPTPNLLPLAQVVEDFPRYAVLIADQHDATLSIINRASRIYSVSVEGSDYPRHHKQGGWSQLRFQNRANVRRQSFARAVAEETRRALQENNIGMLILAAGDVIKPMLTADFHSEVTERLIGEIRLDIRTTESEIIEATMPIVERAERERELQAVKALMDAVGAGNRGVIGPEATLEALSNGQVLTLLMASDFHHDGWADYTMNLFGVGPVPGQHPAGGDVKNLHPVDIAEEMVRLTVVTDAEGEVIHEDGDDDAMLRTQFRESDGVGALLRF